MAGTGYDRYDPTVWRRSRRTGRQKGVQVFIPAADLRALGIDPDGPAPEYRTRPGTKGTSVFVNLRRA